MRNTTQMQILLLLSGNYMKKRELKRSQFVKFASWQGITAPLFMRIIRIFMICWERLL